MASKQTSRQRGSFSQRVLLEPFALLGLGATALLSAAGLAGFLALGWPSHGLADAGHEDEADERMHMMEEMMERHQGHEHGHDFEGMKDVSPDDMRRVMRVMMEVGLALPPMSSERGRDLFMQKGCVVCHSVNGVGGLMGPSLDAADMPEPMNAFEFAARMWRGAPAMVGLQEQVLGGPVSLTGQELADIVAFAHDEAAQKTLSADEIPPEYRDLVAK